MCDSVKDLSFPCIAAHRGSCGGNIPPNSIPAYEAAILQGADIIEMDIARSADGVLYMFHTGNEKKYFGVDAPFESLSSAAVNRLKLRNEFGNETPYECPRFADVLERLKGRCVLNLDRCWQYWEQIIPLVDSFGMKEQIILKSPCKEEWIKKVLDVAPSYNYMPIINEDIQPFYDMGGEDIPGFMGAELVFRLEDSRLLRYDVVGDLHQKGKFAWGNGIVFSQEKVLSAGHSDDSSILNGPETGWGWLIDHHFDIIQTDWIAMLDSYLKKRHLQNE